MSDSNIQLAQAVPSNAQHIVFPIFEGEHVKNDIGITIPPFVTKGFEAKMGKKKIWINDNQQQICLLGLGKKEEIHNAHMAFRSYAFKESAEEKTCYIHLKQNPQRLMYECAYGLALAGYSPAFFKQKKKERNINFSIITNEIDHLTESVFSEALLTAETQKGVMQLVDYPANLKTPAYLADWAIASGAKYGYKVKVIAGDEVKQEGLHALWAVGKSSEHPPQFIIMDYTPGPASASRHTLGLVGKGITFDTGGISIKPHNNLHYMKSDMGGAAVVLAAVELAAKLQLDLRVIGIVPCAENIVDKESMKPGDVIQSYSGKSIEIINTDAEGRLVLADGLAYLAKNYEADTVLDFATLTGSIVRALGNQAAGLFTKNEGLAKDIITAAEDSYNRVWPLPLWDAYQSEMDSDVADIKNLGTSPLAGAITAAKFLEFFIPDHPRWAHFDIAGVSFKDSEFAKMKSASGYGVRLMVQLMKKLIEQSK